MKWANVSDMLVAQFEKIGPTAGYEMFPSCSSSSEFEQAVRREHTLVQKEVLSAIEFFVRTGHWPEMSPKCCFFLKPRLLFAWNVTASMGTPLLGEPLPTFTANLEHHLVWALVDIWNTVGLDIWLSEEANRFQFFLGGKDRGSRA